MADMQPHPNLARYVDVEDALQRVCGNKMIYKKLLGTFVSTLQYDQLCREISSGDFETAAKTAHAIKGVTANLSMKAAYEKIIEVESQLKGGSINPSNLEELDEILRTTLACVEYLIATL